MRRFEIAQGRSPMAPAVRSALALLDRQVAQALGHIGHPTGFVCTSLPGTPVQCLYEALDTQLVCSADNEAGYRPRLGIAQQGPLHVLAVPAARVAVHREAMLASYLLRAHADAVLQPLVASADHRNRLARDYADGWLFGDYAKFLGCLQFHGSLDSLHHQGDVPMGLVLGYAAKFNTRRASLVSLYGLNVTGRALALGDPYRLEQRQRVGEARPLMSHLRWLQESGVLDVSGTRPQHVSMEDHLGKQVVAICSQVGGFYGADTGERMGDVVRTVFWSLRAGTGDLLDDARAALSAQ